MVDIVPEKSTRTLTINFKDDTNQPVTPMSANYSIIDKYTNTTIRETTTFTPTTPTHEIELTGNDNRIITPANIYEVRIITITWHYSGNKVENTEYVYKIKNLKGIT